MKLHPIKARPECSKYYACYYINFDKHLDFRWRFSIVAAFSKGEVVSTHNIFWKQYK